MSVGPFGKIVAPPGLVSTLVCLCWLVFSNQITPVSSGNTWLLQDYARNNFDPSNFTGSPHLAYDHVNNHSTAQHLHSGRLIFREDIPSWPTNIVYTKGVKVGGSTLAGVVRHMSRHFGILGAYAGNPPVPGVTEPHMWATTIRRAVIDRNLADANLSKPVFRLGWMRDPLSRCMSAFYFFQEKRGAMQGTDEVQTRYVT